LEKDNIGKPDLNILNEKKQLEKLKEIRIKREAKERKALNENKTRNTIKI